MGFPHLLSPWSAASTASDIQPDTDPDTEPDPSETPHRSSPDATDPSSVSFLLRQFATPGVHPTTARVSPQLLQRQSPSLSFRDAWRFGAFVASKATEITLDVLRHHVRGPRKKSWGIEMTLITSILRNAGSHSYLADVNRLRTLMHLSGWVPVPSDALVTPVTFRVHRRKLRGFLAKFDKEEDGTRELEGEWIIGRHLWKKLQAEFHKSRAGHAKTNTGRLRLKERVILFLHGGAYYFFSAATHRVITIPLSKYTESRIFAINYRLAPETRFPGQLHDSVLAYLRLIKDLKIPPENILVAGDSAGGGLALALLMYLRDNEYPLPAGAILMSPWVDLTMSCDSWDSNAEFDVVPFPPDVTDHLNPIPCYLGPEGMEKYLTHPYASPLFGNFEGLPPLLVQSGEAEVLRDEITLLAHKATLAGVSVQHELYEDAVHVFQMFPFLAASRKSFTSARQFAFRILPYEKLVSSDDSDAVVLAHEFNSERSRLVSGLGEVEGKPSASEEPDQDTSVEDIADQPVQDEGREDSMGPGVDESKNGSDNETILASPFPETRYTAHTSRRNHKRTATFGAGEHGLLTVAPLVSPTAKSHTITTSTTGNEAIRASAQLAPPPTTRRRDRAMSHPDITALCSQWAMTGPANETTTFKPR